MGRGTQNQAAMATESVSRNLTKDRGIAINGNPQQALHFEDMTPYQTVDGQTVHAIAMDHAFSVNTLQGAKQGLAGDYLVQDEKGSMPVAAQDFAERFLPLSSEPLQEEIMSPAVTPDIISSLFPKNDDFPSVEQVTLEFEKLEQELKQKQSFAVSLLSRIKFDSLPKYSLLHKFKGAASSDFERHFDQELKNVMKKIPKSVEDAESMAIALAVREREQINSGFSRRRRADPNASEILGVPIELVKKAEQETNTSSYSAGDIQTRSYRQLQEKCEAFIDWSEEKGEDLYEESGPGRASATYSGALLDYQTGDSFYFTNGALRAAQEDVFSPVNGDQLQGSSGEQAFTLDDMFEDLPVTESPLILTRIEMANYGLEMELEDGKEDWRSRKHIAAQTEVGAEVVHAGFTSSFGYTELETRVIDPMGQSDNKLAHYIIELPAGSKAYAFPTAYKGKMEENEVLLPRNTVFKTRRVVESEHSGPTIYVEAITPNRLS